MPSFYRAARTLLSAFLVAAGCAQSGTAPMSAEPGVCSRVLCRPPQTVRIVTGPGTVDETVIGLPLPYIVDGLVLLFPGEKLFIEANVEGDRLVNLTAVKAVREPARTFVLEMRQNSNGDTIFTATNPFPRRVKYHLRMVDGGSLRETSSCPVRENGGFAIEHWPHPIFQLVLTEPRFVDGAMRCEY